MALARWALAYVTRLGWAVLPLRPNGKTPLTPHGVKDASADPDEVRAWWQRWPDANIGVAVPKSVLVVDVDVRNGGLETVYDWPRLPGERLYGQQLPSKGDWVAPTPRQVTASGGSHTLIARPSGALRGKAGQGVDILTSGRYIVAAPSLIAGIAYRWTTSPRHPLAACPPWLDALIRPPAASAPLPAVTPPSDAYARALAYVAKCDPAVSGQGGHAATFRVASLLIHPPFSLPIPLALQVLQLYSQRCLPPWSEAELKHKLRSAQAHPGHDPAKAPSRR